jgi:hypothetical protein
LKSISEQGQNRPTAKFRPGQSGNPGGRPKTTALLRQLAQDQAEANVRALVEIRDNKRASASARIAAIRELFDRGFGKAIQTVDGKADLLLPVHFVIEGLYDSESAPSVNRRMNDTCAPSQKRQNN